MIATVGPTPGSTDDPTLALTPGPTTGATVGPTPGPTGIPTPELAPLPFLFVDALISCLLSSFSEGLICLLSYWSTVFPAMPQPYSSREGSVRQSLRVLILPQMNHNRFVVGLTLSFPNGKRPSQ